MSLSRKTALAGLAVIALAVLAGALPTRSAAGMEASGKVVAVRDGVLERRVEGAWKPLRAGDAVSFGDRLRTRVSTVAVLALPGVGRVVLGPDTEVELGRDQKDWRAGLDRGALWMKTALPPGAQASVTAPLGTAGVRGTRFTVISLPDWQCVCSCRGALEFTPREGAGVPVPSAMAVTRTSAPTGPAAAVSPQFILDRTGTGAEPKFDFCFTCHVVGSRSEIRRDFEE